MDQSLTPTLKLAGTSNEILDRNFRRIDDAFVAKAASAALPKTPIDPITSTPTIGLAATNSADLNHDFRLIDALFSATPPTLSTSRLRYTGNEVLTRNFQKIVYAFIAAAIAIPPPEASEDVIAPEPTAHVSKKATKHEKHDEKHSKKEWW